jgi:hypothetical protein
MIEIEILLTFVYFLECTVVQCKIEIVTAMNVRESVHSVHQNSVEIYWTELYRGRLLTLITGGSSRLLRIRFSADLVTRIIQRPLSAVATVEVNEAIDSEWNITTGLFGLQI